MKRGPAFGLFFCGAVLPSIAFAQVVIDEIMYDPAGADSGHEWVELYNAGGSDAALVGGSGKDSWRLSDGSNHTLTDPAGGVGRGSLTIPAGGYLVIASDPDQFIAEYPGGSYAVVKSSISLNNTGATLSLLDGSGTAVNSVSYSSDQGGSGDGNSLQKTSDGSWVAANPTPGAANAAEASSAESGQPAQDSGSNASTTDETKTGEVKTENQPMPVSSYVPPPTPDLFADAGGDRTAIVGADVEFDASAYDKDQKILDPSTVRFSWNFGDGSSAEGAAVLHHFSYPGRYAVVLNIAEDKNAAMDEITVTAEPAALSVSLLPDGGVQIQNLAGHDLDLSGWIVRENGSTFAAQFMVPEHSEILADASMQISPDVLAFRASSSTTLEYPNGTPALVMGERSTLVQDPHTKEGTQAPAALSAAAAPAAPPAPKPVVKAALEPAADAPAQSAAQETEPDETPAASSTVILEAAAASAPGARLWWWVGLVALILAAAAAAVAAGHFKKREWDIVEDVAE